MKVYRVDARDHDAFLDLGELGRSVSLPRKGDRLVVSADFIRPVYPYLIAVNPDGSWENIEPAAVSLPSAKQATAFRHPSGNQYLTLDDPGFTALILLASDQPLAPRRGEPTRGSTRTSRFPRCRRPLVF